MFSKISKAVSGWRSRYRALDANGRTCVWLVVACCLVCIVLILVLRGMEHPWEGKTAKRVANGERVRPEDYGRIGEYWTGGGNAVLWALLALSVCRWWPRAGGRDELPLAGRGKTGVERDSGWRDGGRMKRLGWLVLVAILLLAGWIRYPQLNRSVMFDEQDNLRWNIHGYYDMEHESGKPVFKDAGWEGALFGNRKGNNPVLLSATSRASIAVWRRFSGAPIEVFSRKAMRFPVFIVGLVSIAGIYWFLALLGMRRAAVLAALLAAVHPFHIEYSIEARGYGFVMMGASLAAPCALLALRTNRWRWWVGLGLSFFLMLYAFLGSVYFVAMLAATIAGYLGVRAWRHRDPAARAGLVRLGVAGIVTLSLYLQLSVPALMQFKEIWISQGYTNHLGMEWLFAVVTEYSTGALLVPAWREAAEAMGRGVGLFEYVTRVLFESDPWYVMLVFVVIPVAAGLGFVRLLRLGLEMRLLLAAVIMAPLLMFLHHRFGTHSVLMFWYLIFFLPTLIVFVAVGLDTLGWGLASRMGRVPGAGWTVTWALIPGLFFWMFIIQTQAGKLGRNSQSRGDERPYVSYKRGHYHWVVYRNGYSIRVHEDNTIPEQFDPHGTSGSRE